MAYPYYNDIPDLTEEELERARQEYIDSVLSSMIEYTPLREVKTDTWRSDVYPRQRALDAWDLKAEAEENMKGYRPLPSLEGYEPEEAHQRLPIEFGYSEPLDENEVKQSNPEKRRDWESRINLMNNAMKTIFGESPSAIELKTDDSPLLMAREKRSDEWSRLKDAFNSNQQKSYRMLDDEYRLEERLSDLRRDINAIDTELASLTDTETSHGRRRVEELTSQKRSLENLYNLTRQRLYGQDKKTALSSPEKEEATINQEEVNQSNPEKEEVRPFNQDELREFFIQTSGDIQRLSDRIDSKELSWEEADRLSKDSSRFSNPTLQKETRDLLKKKKPIRTITNEEKADKAIKKHSDDVEVASIIAKKTQEKKEEVKSTLEENEVKQSNPEKKNQTEALKTWTSDAITASLKSGLTPETILEASGLKKDSPDYRILQYRIHRASKKLNPEKEN